MEAAKQLQQFLLQEWSSGLRLTTIPQALQRLGMEDNVDLRWRAARHLEQLWHDTLTSPEKRRAIAQALGRDLDEALDERWRQQVRTWNLASILLREEEKLVARAILMHQRKGLGFPPPHEMARMLGIQTRQVHQAIRLLARLGFLSLEDGRRPALYALAEGHEGFLDGLGFSFHTVTLDTGDQFGVP
jgi:hypothetical protein